MVSVKPDVSSVPKPELDAEALIREARARQRRRRRWIALVVTVALLGTGLGVGLGTQGVSPSRSPSSRPTTVTAAACQASQLSAKGSRQGGGFGSAAGTIVFTDTSTSPCTLKGVPGLQLLDATGRVLATPSGGHPSMSAVRLAPGSNHTASLIVYWFNWCGTAPGPLTMRITLTSGGGTILAPFNGPPAYVPLCTQPGQPSTLQVVNAYMKDA